MFDEMLEAIITAWTTLQSTLLAGITTISKGPRPFDTIPTAESPAIVLTILDQFTHFSGAGAGTRMDFSARLSVELFATELGDMVAAMSEVQNLFISPDLTKGLVPTIAQNRGYVTATSNQPFIIAGGPMLLGGVGDIKWKVITGKTSNGFTYGLQGELTASTNLGI